MVRIEGRNLSLFHEKARWHLMNEGGGEIVSENVEFIANRINIVASGVSNHLSLIPIDKDEIISCDNNSGAIVCFLEKKID